MAQRFNNLSKRTMLLTIGALLILGAGGYALTRHKSSNVIPSTNTSKIANSPTITTPEKAATSSNTSSAKTPTTTPDNNPVLIAPMGTFVSNHHPSLSGSSQQLAEQSVCNTNSGAQCYIKFTKGSTVKTLATQTTDATGATYWSWNVNDSDLTEGTWTVEAVASLNGQVKTVKDPIDLVVQR